VVDLKVHIKRRHGEYSFGGSSGQYMPNNPLWFKRNIQYHDFGSATVADRIGDTFQPQYVPQQTSRGTSQYYINRPLPTMDDQSYGTGLSQETILKIQELKRLVYKYPQYCPNADEIIRWAFHSYLNGDNTFLDDKLEQLRSIDSLAKY
jgi:hypothetical protein